MGAELVKWQKELPLVSWRLRREKEGLPLRDWLWVYNDAVTATCALPVAGLAALWLWLPLTLHGLAIGLLAVSLAVALAAVVKFADRAGRSLSPLGADPTRPMSHRARAELCRMDRNRRLQPHRGIEREVGLDKQYSVWSTAHGGTVKLMLLEHAPNGGRRWGVRVYQQPGEGQTYDSYRSRYVRVTTPAIKEYQPPDLDRLMEGRAAMEEMAAQLEGQHHDGKVQTLRENREAAQRALMVRRSR